MKNTRYCVFETNSSSTHSISVSSEVNGVYDTIVPEKGTITLRGGSFGWEQEIYFSSLTKANYAAIDVYNNLEHEKMLIEVIKEHTGAKKVIIDLQPGSYIDHQSQGITRKLFKSKHLLKKWIFDTASYLQTDNDNH